MVFVQLDDQMHIAEHLVLKTRFDLSLIIHVQHLLIEISLGISLNSRFVQARSTGAAIFLLNFQHLVELFFTSGQQ